MNALILYDTYFGNTQQVAEKIRDGLSSGAEVKLLKIQDAKPEDLENTDVLIAGSSTRAFRPTKAVKGFFKQLPVESLKNIKIAAFDTRISTRDVNSKFLNIMVKCFGYAAKPIKNWMKKKGGQPIVAAEGFYVQESEGPMKEGELERAVAWGGTILQSAGQ